MYFASFVPTPIPYVVHCFSASNIEKLGKWAWGQSYDCSFHSTGVCMYPYNLIFPVLVSIRVVKILNCVFFSFLSFSLSQVRAVHWPAYLSHLVPTSAVAFLMAAEQDTDQRMSSHELRMWKWLSWVATGWSHGISLPTHLSWQQTQSSTSASSASSMSRARSAWKDTRYNSTYTLDVCCGVWECGEHCIVGNLRAVHFSQIGNCYHYFQGMILPDTNTHPHY